MFLCKVVHICSRRISKTLDLSMRGECKKGNTTSRKHAPPIHHTHINMQQRLKINNYMTLSVVCILSVA